MLGGERERVTVQEVECWKKCWRRSKRRRRKKRREVYEKKIKLKEIIRTMVIGSTFPEGSQRR